MAARGTYASGRARRAEIVAAALQLFAEQGFHGTSLRDIAVRAGLSHPGLLRHFPRKELLLEAVLEEREARVISKFASAHDRPVIEELRAAIAVAVYNANARGLTQLYALISAEATEPSHPAHEFFRARYRVVRGHLTETFQRAREEGVLRDGLDPREAAIDLIAHADGVQLQWLLDPEEVDLVSELSRFTRTFVTVPLGSTEEIAASFERDLAQLVKP